MSIRESGRGLFGVIGMVSLLEGCSVSGSEVGASCYGLGAWVQPKILGWSRTPKAPPPLPRTEQAYHPERLLIILSSSASLASQPLSSTLKNLTS